MTSSELEHETHMTYTQEANKDEGTNASPAMRSALRQKEAGNKAFLGSRYLLAKEHYTKAIEDLQDKRVIATAEANNLACTVHSNLGAAYLNLDLPEEALKHCNLSLAINKKNVKSLFRKSEALKALNQYEKALGVLEQALLIEPNNEQIRVSMDECEDILEFESAPNDAFDPPIFKASITDEDENTLDNIKDDISNRMDVVRLTFQSEGAVEEQVLFSHGQGSFGIILIREAFESSSNLSAACNYVRSQHFAATAEFAIIVAQKSRIQYPLVWWAHPWPLSDLDQDGIILEVHTRDNRKTTWFLPKVPGEQVLGEEILLSKECVLLDDERLFPDATAL